MFATASLLQFARSTGVAIGLTTAPLVAIGLTTATLVAVGAVYAPPAIAQDTADDLRRRLVKLERDMQAMQREMRAASGGRSTRGSGGGTVPPTVAARFEIRMTQLERSIDKLTGRIEDLDFQIKAVAKAQKKFQNDIEFRMSELEKGGSTGGTSSGRPRGTAKRNIASRTPAARTAPPDAPTVRLPDGKPVEQYRFARGFLIERDYPKAQAALEAFVKRHPNSRLTSNAYYWLGETYYAQRNYRAAAVAFADGFKKFKAHPKAPDNLYKLGLSLSKMKLRPQACAAFKELRLRYPTAAPDLRRRADTQRRALGCPG